MWRTPVASQLSGNVETPRTVRGEPLRVGELGAVTLSSSDSNELGWPSIAADSQLNAPIESGPCHLHAAVNGTVDNGWVIASQLEQRVLLAIERLRAGEPSEDDVLEFKREWPTAAKARQLAGAANRARGAELIYVIGVDEKDGSVHSLAGTDAASWFASLEGAFDEVAPEVERHLLISVSESEQVVAVQFRTDRPPYVVAVAQGAATEREVPLRVGTRTRSAKRHELLRLLMPETRVPSVSAIDAELILGPTLYMGDEYVETLEFSFRAELYFEHLDARSVFLPAHAMSARLIGGSVDMEARLYYDPAETLVSHGLNRRRDGIELLGSGVTSVYTSWNLGSSALAELAAVDQWRLNLQFAVAGSDRLARVDLRAANMQRYFEFPEGAHPDAGDEPERWQWEVA